MLWLFLICHSPKVIEQDFLKQSCPVNLSYHTILSHSFTLKWQLKCSDWELVEFIIGAILRLFSGQLVLNKELTVWLDG